MGGTILLVVPDVEKGIARISTIYRSKKKLKIEVKLRSLKIYYDIIDSITIPLTFGSGNYTFNLYEQRLGTSYRLVAGTPRFIQLNNNEAYRLNANDFVPFNEQSKFYHTAKLLRTADNIARFVKTHFNYDYIKALLKARTDFTIPNLEECYEKKKGICYDLAALTAAMMRICGIPAALVIGKSDRANHAWVEVNGKIYDPAKDLTKPNKQSSYLAERYY
jgi:transglutaminase-like putative cysteine protease